MPVRHNMRFSNSKRRGSLVMILCSTTAHAAPLQMQGSDTERVCIRRFKQGTKRKGLSVLALGGENATELFALAAAAGVGSELQKTRA